ncbi:hypothetical protein PC41400_26795 [Paenibacillus chitinolyticus]|uniref:DUF2269 domain-containing protein n=1 Tax=Paenibacillus chitinolyticus TaxID=79263 RepID=A0A410X3B9_9BACL|nr:hypothetical protein [Paenibacillus chitinolyticus]MCY9591168.1 hypothetical protein [Paenibacillus chitinolyticus]MCY9596691.1 hypothetical protein [Paenibacillus chitinolyticus]QAV21087.1 hypothetical protein PC41400_26795 [Paenibacillus chitinolyticus]
MSYRLSMKQKNWVVVLHVLSIVGWLGGAVCMLLLSRHMLYADQGEQLYYTLENMHLIDSTLIRYPALIALVTGIVLSLWTQWGIFKYYWILIKLVLTVSLIVFGITCMGQWLSELFRTADEMRLAALGDAKFLDTAYRLLGGAVANIGALVFMTAISYFKPLGKIRKTARKS